MTVDLDLFVIPIYDPDAYREQYRNLTTLIAMKAKGGYVYIVSNKNRTVLYTGVTSNLYNRIYEHKSGFGSQFTSRYNCTDLVYFEFFESIEEAIVREKQMKKWKRAFKENLINSINPGWKDLFGEVEEMQ
jgi:putative endonuclease